MRETAGGIQSLDWTSGLERWTRRNQLIIGTVFQLIDANVMRCAIIRPSFSPQDLNIAPEIFQRLGQCHLESTGVSTGVYGPSV